MTYVADETKMAVGRSVQDAIMAITPNLEQAGIDPSSVSINPAIASTTVITVKMPDGKKRVFLVKFSESY